MYKCGTKIFDTLTSIPWNCNITTALDIHMITNALEHTINHLTYIVYVLINTWHRNLIKVSDNALAQSQNIYISQS